MLRQINRNPSTRAAVALVALLSSASLAIGQTKIVAPDNKYSVQEDVKLGREAAQQVEEQLPLLRDNQVEDYVENLGARIAENIPAGISSFGIPLYVQGRERARHQRLRASGRADVCEPRDDRSGKNRRRSRGRHRPRSQPRGASSWHRPGQQSHEIRNRIGCRPDSGRHHRWPAWVRSCRHGSQFGFGTAFLRFAREYEKQADILGAQIMARAGYDPRDMANMFKTIEKTSGGGGPRIHERSSESGQPLQVHQQEAQVAAA